MEKEREIITTIAIITIIINELNIMAIKMFELKMKLN